MLVVVLVVVLVHVIPFFFFKNNLVLNIKFWLALYRVKHWGGGEGITLLLLLLLSILSCMLRTYCRYPLLTLRYSVLENLYNVQLVDSLQSSRHYGGL